MRDDETPDNIPYEAPDNTLYEEDGDYRDDLAVSGDYRNLLQWQHLLALGFIGSLEKKCTILDVGCFNGFFVRKLLDAGFDASGIDFNRTAIDFGIREYGLEGRIAVADLDRLREEGRRFGVITLFDVIEHLENPHRVVQEACGLLDEGGFLIVSVPNSRMLWRPPLDFPPHHLSRFTPGSLCRLLSGNGFTVLKHYEQMSLFNLLRNFAGILFRNKGERSMRGGRLGSSRRMNVARTLLNRSRPLLCVALSPLDKLLFRCGLRYIGQVAICVRKK